MLAERRKGIAETRALLKNDPEAIWRFDVAINRTRAESMVTEPGIHDDILDEHIAGIKRWELTKG